ncbi:MAG TPA: hypothetical protein VG320_27055 [Paraburkholderia sp.]|jgi:hypothetical protein|uniref:hypothetical protein n=1 Tax=Paraburkholderia sp. TaxID=1926495 RepID=UPI002DF10B57|nr:hypothetical protein [Paraburkholderia sp.]
MTKDEYVNHEFVAQFIDWMSEKLDDETFAHAYTMRKWNRHWSCGSLFDAYKNYYWPHGGVKALGVAAGHTFESNAEALEALQKGLVDALLAGDDKRACELMCALMAWGGVQAGNVSWLTANEAGLAALVAKTRDALNAGDAQDLRFNSGMSKAYSLVCNEFVIYDSRVAAALGMAIVKFCVERKLESVPAELQFPWAPAKSAKNAVNPPVRDPRQGRFDFLRLGGGRLYAAWNLRASWLLSTMAKRLAGGASGFAGIESDARRLRALEAALFMIGYDLGRDGGATGNGGNNVPEPRPPVQVIRGNDDSDWVECFTPSHGNRFEYRIEDHQIAINGPLNFNHDLIDRTLTNLFVHFGQSPFSLANNAVNVPAGTEQMGLGVAYVQAGGNNAPNTSKLAAILQDLDVFEPCFDRPGPGRHWTLNLEALGLVDGKVNIRPWLNEYRKDE